jgi:hypothetical protein
VLNIFLLRFFVLMKFFSLPARTEPRGVTGVKYVSSSGATESFPVHVLNIQIGLSFAHLQVASSVCSGRSKNIFIFLAATRQKKPFHGIPHRKIQAYGKIL